MTLKWIRWWARFLDVKLRLDHTLSQSTDKLRSDNSLFQIVLIERGFVIKKLLQWWLRLSRHSRTDFPGGKGKNVFVCDRRENDWKRKGLYLYYLLHNSIVTKTVKIFILCVPQKKVIQVWNYMNVNTEFSFLGYYLFKSLPAVLKSVCMAWSGFCLGCWSHRGGQGRTGKHPAAIESESESDVTWPSMVTNTRNLCSGFNPSKRTHTAVNTHTHTHTVNTHGEQLGVRCLAQGHLSRGIQGGRERYIHSLHLQFLPDLRLELATFGFPNHDFPVRTYMIATS